MAAHQISSSHAPNQCSFHGNRISGCLAAARSVPTKWQINNVDSITLPQRCLSFLPVRALVWISCASARQDMSTADQDRATQPKKKRKMLSGGVGWKLVWILISHWQAGHILAPWGETHLCSCNWLGGNRKPRGGRRSHLSCITMRQCKMSCYKLYSPTPHLIQNIAGKIDWSLYCWRNNVEEMWRRRCSTTIKRNCKLNAQLPSALWSFIVSSACFQWWRWQ